MLLLNTGLTVNDFHDITFGMALNFMWEKKRITAASRGKEQTDPERQYNIMKANLPALEEMYKAGEIPKSKYDAYIEKLKEWESEE